MIELTSGAAHHRHEVQELSGLRAPLERTQTMDLSLEKVSGEQFGDHGVMNRDDFVMRERTHVEDTFSGRRRMRSFISRFPTLLPSSSR